MRHDAGSHAPTASTRTPTGSLLAGAVLAVLVAACADDPVTAPDTLDRDASEANSPVLG